MENYFKVFIIILLNCLITNVYAETPRNSGLYNESGDLLSLNSGDNILIDNKNGDYFREYF